MNYDLIVIGGGPAGYVGAIRAAQLGKRVACIEKERAGGTCLNWGCIPTKALLRSAELYQLMSKRAGEFGLQVDNPRFDWAKIIKRSRDVTDKNAAGIEYLFKKNKIDHLRGEAALTAPGTVQVTLADGTAQSLTAEKILVATGCVPRPIPGLPFNGKTVLSSREAMVLPTQPKSIIVVGGGAIGTEFSYFYNAFGTKVTLIEMLPNLLSYVDTEASLAVEKAFQRQGITVLPGTRITHAEASDQGVRLTVEGKKTETIEAEIALVAAGIQPVLPKSAQPFELTERGFVQTNDAYQTNIPGVYAAGDLIGPPLLAHMASYEAIQAVEGMFTPGFQPKKPLLSRMPGCIYSHPQVGSVGLCEQDAKAAGIAYKIGKYPFMANGKARAIGETDGFVKLLIGEADDKLIGATIVGAEATELIAELGLAITLGATWEQVAATIHAHPTLSEAIHEAAGAPFGHAIHM